MWSPASAAVAASASAAAATATAAASGAHCLEEDTTLEGRAGLLPLGAGHEALDRDRAEALLACLGRLSSAEADLAAVRAAILGALAEGPAAALGGRAEPVERPGGRPAASKPPAADAAEVQRHGGSPAAFGGAGNGGAPRAPQPPSPRKLPGAPGPRFADQAAASLCATGRPLKSHRAEGRHRTTERLGCSSWLALPVLHPEHPRLLLWNLVGVVFLTYIVFMLPYELSFGPCSSNELFVVASVVDVYYILDVIVTFRTGYEDEETKCVVMDPDRIARRYVRCWFYVDAVAAIPWDWADALHLPYLQSTKALRSMRTLRISQVARCFRLCRTYLLGNRLDIFLENNLGLGFIMGVLRVLFVLLGVTHWAACVWFFIGSIDDGRPSWVDKHLDQDVDAYQAYVYSLYFTLTTMTTVGYGDIVAQNFTEVCFVLLLLLLASVVFASMMGELTDLIRSGNRDSHILSANRQKLAQYVRWRRLPKSVAVPIRTHLVWLWEMGEGFDAYEAELKSCLSPLLQRELSYQVYGGLIRNAPFLQWIRVHEPCMKELTVLLSSSFLSPGDKIFRVGEPNEQIFMLKSGIVRLSMNDSLHNTGPQQLAPDLADPAPTPAAGARWADLAAKPSSKSDALLGAGAKTEAQDRLSRVSFAPGSFANRPHAFTQATRELRGYEATLSWSARVIQKLWRKRHPYTPFLAASGPCRRGQWRDAYPADLCPRLFRRGVPLAPRLGGWDTATPHKFAYSARCESLAEVVCMRRAVVKEIMDKFSPWLEDRFEVFRQAVARRLTEGQDVRACARPPLPERPGPPLPPPAGTGQGSASWRPQPASAPPAAAEGPAGAARVVVDWRAAWSRQAWNRLPGERLVNCTASGGPASGSVRLTHASSVSAEWNGVGSYDEGTVRVEFANGRRLSGSLGPEGSHAPTIQWSDGTVWTWAQPPTGAELPAAPPPGRGEPRLGPLSEPLLRPL
ncbi:unnamed protein product [Prorocentrum cordatum]|uniref:Cyclic nucleotide-binding domain-containing protein n=1 Tax=Prorocentrum cordatum TaxID=2364126 RepID=A0ABN9WDN2_9DINO|nr:unnamed protein product [Polarella glacialis]